MKTTFINSTVAEYTDKEFSWYQDFVLATGYFASQDGTPKFQAVQKAIPSLGIDVTAGKILVPFIKGGADWKVICEIPTDQSFVVTPNASGAVRADTLIVKLDTTADPNVLKTNIATLVLLQGTGTTPLTDGAINTINGAGYIFTRLADIYVPNGATTILDSNISNVLPKVKSTKAIDIDSDSISYVGETGIGANGTIVGTADGAIKKGNVVRVKDLDYRADDFTNSARSETVFSNGGGLTLGGDFINKRGGIYKAYGKDWLFFVVNGVIRYITKTSSDTMGGWSVTTASPISVYNQSHQFFTMGMTKTGLFHFCYAKDATGNLYYRLGTPQSNGTITFGGEQLAFANTGTFYFRANTAYTANQLDSEVVNGKYYVVFSAKNAAGNLFKPIMISNTATDGTWTMEVSFPYALESETADTDNALKVGLSGVGNKKLGISWSKEYPLYFRYIELNTDTLVFSAIESTTIRYVASDPNNPYYTKGISVSYLKGLPVVATMYASGGTALFANSIKNINGVWSKVVNSGLTNRQGQGLYTDGNFVRSINGSTGGSANFNMFKTELGQWFTDELSGTPLGWYSPANQTGLILEGKQSEDGLNSYFAIACGQFATSSFINIAYSGWYPSDNKIKKIESSVYHPIAISNGDYLNGQTVTAVYDGIVSGLDLISGKVYYSDGAGNLTDVYREGYVRVGVAKSASDLQVNIEPKKIFTGFKEVFDIDMSNIVINFDSQVDPFSVSYSRNRVALDVKSGETITDIFASGSIRRLYK